MKEVQKGSKPIELESKIIQVIRKDNSRGNTIHFHWDRTPFSPSNYILDVITHNVFNGQNFLLKRMEGESHIECLSKMLEYVESAFQDEYSWTVYWTDSQGEQHKSYFRGVDEDEVKQKFFYEEKTEAVINSIKMSPMT